MTARSQERGPSIIGYKICSHGCIFLAYTVIIYLLNKIKSGLYRIYFMSMLEVNSQQSGFMAIYFLLDCLRNINHTLSPIIAVSANRRIRPKIVDFSRYDSSRFSTQSSSIYATLNYIKLAYYKFSSGIAKRKVLHFV